MMFDILQQEFKTNRSMDPTWLSDFRDHNYRKFEELGFPTTKSETWRYMDLNHLRDLCYSLPKSEVSSEIFTSLRFKTHKRTLCCSFLNGKLKTVESGGVDLSSLGLDAFGEESTWLEERLDGGDISSHPFRALNGAFLDHVVTIRSESLKGAFDEVILDFVWTSAEEAMIASPRVMIEVQTGQELQVMNIHRGVACQKAMVNLATDIWVKPGGRLNYLKYEENQETHIDSTRVSVGRDGYFRGSYYGFGSAVSRVSFEADLIGSGAECFLDGLQITSRNEHSDFMSEIRHMATNTTSHEYVKGVLGGKSSSAFYGYVFVDAEAQKTDAVQTNRNLLLSQGAVANSRPQLEIYADDVKCAHGSTVGQLDESQVFYLRSRGFTEAKARAELTKAFVAELFSHLSNREVSSWLMAKAEARIAESLGEA
ncbi:MAG: SufD family Fe-S cluster assembly protein [Myxococcota bacterium]|nr:SufD family Fe-S cluster assembly protein [Myxococcota bacterium]